MKVHLGNLSHLLSTYCNQNMKLNPEASIALTSITMNFLNQVLFNISEELDDQKKQKSILDNSDSNSEEIPIEHESSFSLCKATPNYLVINTNVLISALDKTQFRNLSKKAEQFSLKILKRKRNKSLSIISKMPCVSTDDFLVLTRNLVENGHKINPDDLTKKRNEKKRSNRKKKTQREKRRKKDRFFF